ncbi:MAG: FkbM family methyltransferase [Verrucomicrobiota bacterium]
MLKSFLRTFRFIYHHPLASRNKPEALLRWIGWQVGSRILRKPMVMPFVKDSVLVVESGMTGATGNIYCGLHEFADMALVLHFLRPGDLFLDLGANIGSYTILAAKVAGAQCIAVEPVPATFARLQRNLRINDLEKQVEVCQCAVGSSNGRIQFSADQDTTNRVVDRTYDGQSISVPVRTVDDLLGGRPTMMWKMDVEGFEREALGGAMASLRNEHLNLILLESDEPELTAMMTNAGFVRCNYNPFLRQLNRSVSQNKSQNNLWVKNTSAAEARCQNAPKLSLLGVEF